MTAVEYNQDIANIYAEFFPGDTVVVGDAHQYLLDHYKEFDFIWSSPPCPSHSAIRRCGALRGQYPAVYPDIALWQEITLLTYFCTCPWVIENVKPYYTPIIIPKFKLGRHFFWSNFYVQKAPGKLRSISHNEISGSSVIYEVDLSEFNIPNKKQILRNMVNPELGLHILNTAMDIKTDKVGKQLLMF